MTTVEVTAPPEEVPERAPSASVALAIARTADELDLPTLAKIMIHSGFFPTVKAASQAVVKVLAGRELGFGPIASMRNIDVIQGQISLRYPLVGAIIKRHPRHDYRLVELTTERCEIAFYEKRDDESEWEDVGHFTFTIKDAEKAGLLNKPGTVWRQYARNMLFARCLTNGARLHCPNIFVGGIYTGEELGKPEPIEEEPTE